MAIAVTGSIHVCQAYDLYLADININNFHAKSYDSQMVKNIIWLEEDTRLPFSVYTEHTMYIRGVTWLDKHQSNNSNSKNSFKLENSKQISGFNPSFHQHHLGGNKEEGSKVLTFSLHIRSYPPRLHVTRDWTSKAGSCLLGARFKLLILLGFTVMWHLEILLNTPVNAITLQIFLRALQLTTKEVYTCGLKFIAQVQGKQVQKNFSYLYTRWR